MSTLAVNTITNAAGGNTAQINGMTPTADSLQGFRNRIINGDMRIAQRGTAAVTASGSFAVDRFLMIFATDGAFSAQQDSSAPAGFINSLKVTATTADSTLTGTQQLSVAQRIEGTNIADFGFGTASAKTVTLSFWVRSSLTGTFGGSLRNNGGSRSYAFTYSISSADTWEQKYVTIAGDTSGTWLTDTGRGLEVNFGLGVGPDRTGTAGSWANANYATATGAVSVIGTLDATWQITGVQLEAGSVATPFERIDYGRQLIQCQRYYYKTKATATNYVFGLGQVGTTTISGHYIPLPISMRTAPTALEQSGTAADYKVNTAGSSTVCSAVPVFALVASPNMVVVDSTVASGLTTGRAISLLSNDANAFLAWSAEL